MCISVKIHSTLTYTLSKQMNYNKFRNVNLTDDTAFQVVNFGMCSDGRRDKLNSENEINL